MFIGSLSASYKKMHFLLIMRYSGRRPHHPVERKYLKNVPVPSLRNLKTLERHQVFHSLTKWLSNYNKFYSMTE